VSARSLSAILVAAAMTLGGCGGSGKDDAPPAKIASKADYIKAGDKICHDRDDRSLKLAKASDNKGNVAELTGELAKIYADAIARQRALALPPGSARAGARRYVKSVVAMSRPVQRMKAAADVLAKADDDAAVKTAAAHLQSNVNTVQSIGDLADQEARTYGFKVCGQQQAQNTVA
jgi:hypothetical protein